MHTLPLLLATLLTTSAAQDAKRAKLPYALLIEGDGRAYVVGTGFTYFLQAPGAPEICMPRTPLTYRNVAAYRIDARGAFSLSSWQGNGGTAYQVSAEAGVLSSTQPGGSIY